MLTLITHFYCSPVTLHEPPPAGPLYVRLTWCKVCDTKILVCNASNISSACAEDLFNTLPCPYPPKVTTGNKAAVTL